MMKFIYKLLVFTLCLSMLLPAAVMAKQSGTAKENISTEKEVDNMTDSTKATGKKPLLVAYYNASQVVSYEFSGIDVLNYHPANIVANSMSNPESGSIVNHPYSSAMATLRNKARAQNPNIKILFTVANMNINDFESWFYNKTHAEKLANEMMSIIKTYGYDGFDIDYEFPSDSNNMRTNFVYFMQRMREKLDALSVTNGKEYYLSMAVPGTHWAFSLFKMNELAKYVDYFNIMNYDLYVNQPYTHHHTPPYDNSELGYINGSVYGDIQLYLENGIPADKIVPGCGLYSRRWSGVANVNNGLFQKGTIDETNIHLTDILARYVNRNGFVRYWDEKSQAPYVYNASSGVFLSYDDAQSVEVKCKIVGEEGVRGIMVFDYCTADGIGLYDSMRTWLDDYSNLACKDGHSYGDWEQFAAPTFKTEGEERRYCSVCGKYESKSIPMLVTVTPASVSVEYNKVTLTEANNIIRVVYGKGFYMTADALIAASGFVIEGEYLAPYIEDGKFILILPDEGNYTVCVTMSDTRTFMHTAKITIPVPAEPSVSAVGAVITVDGLDAEVKDVFIAQGEYDNYTDVNANKLARITQNKLGGAKSCDYTVAAVGKYTVLIRYNDGEMKLLYITVTEPNLSPNGLQLTVGNLKGVKLIRTAHGVYETGPEIKRAEGSRAFSAKNVLKDVDEYTIQYRKSGKVTIAVCYENGYTFIYKAEITKKSPTFVQNGNTVTIGRLDDLKVIRYVKGEYATSSEIKNAEGCVSVSGKIMKDDPYSVTLDPGVYTFCVQYNDESYNYFVVTIE